jgi:hypothetical protein
MTKREQYGLNFSRLKMLGFSDSFICGGTTTINGSTQLANLLEVLSDRESENFLEEVVLALNGGNYEEIYRPDSSSVDKIQITPSNAIINDDLIISLIELKQLLEEWVAYINKY